MSSSVTETLGQVAEESGIVDAFAPVFANLTLQKLLYIGILIVVCIVVVRLLLRLVNRFLAKGKVEPSLHAFVRTAAKIVLWFLAVIVIAGSLGVNISSLVAVLGVVGLAISLAIQGSLSNLAGGIQILMSKPFRVGEYIQANGIEGTVEEISLVHTKVRTVDNKLVYIPNSEMSPAKVTNYTTEPQRRVDLTFTASYDAPPEKVKQTIRTVIGAHPKALHTPEPFVRVSAYKDSSVEYAVRVWCDTADYWELHFDLLEQVKEAFDQNGIEMTYPHLNVHMVRSEDE